MNTYYIDFTNGNDALDGRSIKTAWKSQHPDRLQPGDTVLFKRGGFLRGVLRNPSGLPGQPITYGAYGEGDNPVFCGSVDASDPAFWEPVGENLWKCTIHDLDEVGNFMFADGTCGTLRWEKEDLREQGDWYDDNFGRANRALKPLPDHTVLMYSVKNPGEFYDGIECGVLTHRYLAHCGHDMNFYDLTFQNCAFHGIAGEEGGRNLHVKGCQFLRIGGAVWSKERRIRFGNAFECWNIAENVVVENCLFDDIYDSATTHQGGKECQPADGFYIRSCTFRRCGMAAFEQRDVLPERGGFIGNICEAAGEGFSKLGEVMPRKSEIWPQPMGHHIFLWRIPSATGNEDFQIRDNVFRNAPYGAAIYSVNAVEADKATIVSGNHYEMEEFVLLNRFCGVDYPDLDAWNQRET